MFRTSWLAWGGAAATAVALLGWAFAPAPVQVESAAVSIGHFEQAIEEDGQTRLKDRYTVSTPMAARLTRIGLREGDRVAAGDAVAVLVPVMSSMVDERSAREATARHKAATANVARAGARIDRVALAVEEAQLELHRTEKLAREGFLSTSRLDSARLALDGARHDAEMARAEREAAVQEQAQAAAALLPVSASIQLGRPFTVRAPVDGQVLRITQPSEATLPAGTALLDIGDIGRLEVVADLLTTDAVQAQAGRRAMVERWGGPPAAGTVRRVDPAAFTKVSALGIEEQRVKVVVELDAAPPPAWRVMGDGYRVTLRVITQSVDQVVLAPVGALFPFADGGMAVYRVDGGRARLQPVEVAGRNGSQAWIRSGLEAGQQVVVYPPPALDDGKRIRVRRP